MKSIKEIAYHNSKITFHSQTENDNMFSKWYARTSINSRMPIYISNHKLPLREFIKNKIPFKCIPFYQRRAFFRRDDNVLFSLRSTAVNSELIRLNGLSTYYDKLTLKLEEDYYD